MSKAVIGLIAGGGDLPVFFLEKAAAAGVETVLFEIKGDINPRLAGFKGRRHTVNMTGLSGILKLFKKEKVNKMMMLGYVNHKSVLKNVRFDLGTMKVLLALKDWSAGSILGAVAGEFEKNGIKVLKTTYLMEELLAPAGCIGRVKPSAKQMKDVKFGFSMARVLSKADIGQTAVVKNGVVAAAEAQENTDACIERGAKIAGRGFVAAKAARPGQDMRFDVPVIGLKTVELVKKLGGCGIVVERGRTFLLDREKTLKYADKNGIFIYGMK